MRQDFASSMTTIEQLMRVSSAKRPGRKHQKRIGPARKGNNDMRHAGDSAKHRSVLARKYKDKVARYWRGDLDVFPIRSK